MNVTPKVSMTASSDETKEHLILEIQKYPCLYDSSRESYHCKQIRSNAWSKVSAACGCPGKEEQCKIAWKRLKEKFRRQRSLQSSGRLSDPFSSKRQWNLYEAMSFIEPFSVKRSTSLNSHVDSSKSSTVCTLASPNNTADEEIILELESSHSSPEQGAMMPSILSVSTAMDLHESGKSDGLESLFQGSFGTSNSGPSPKKRPKLKRPPDGDPVTEMILKALQDTYKIEEEDSTMQFYKCMAKYARTLPPKHRLDVQDKVYNVIMEAVRNFGDVHTK